MTCAQQIESLADKTSTARADTDRADTGRADMDRADTGWAEPSTLAGTCQGRWRTATSPAGTEPAGRPVGTFIRSTPARRQNMLAQEAPGVQLLFALILRH